MNDQHLTFEEIEEAEKICEAATPGPWKECGADRDGCICRMVYSIPLDDVVAAARVGDDCGADLESGRREDALFIAKAREGWPRALADIRKLDHSSRLASIAILYLAGKLASGEKMSTEWVNEAFAVAKKELERMEPEEEDD